MNPMKEDLLTTVLVEQLQNGGIKKLTRSHRKAEFRREHGDNSFRADIFIALSKEDSQRDTFDRNSVNFIAIEVKIKDWKQGLYQAWKYNTFAEKSFLALYKKYAKNVDISMFQQYNVGLISFDENTIEVLNVPKNNRFQAKSYSDDLRERLWSRLAVKSVQPAF